MPRKHIQMSGSGSTDNSYREASICVCEFMLYLPLEAGLNIICSQKVKQARDFLPLFPFPAPHGQLGLPAQLNNCFKTQDSSALKPLRYL